MTKEEIEKEKELEEVTEEVQETDNGALPTEEVEGTSSEEPEKAEEDEEVVEEAPKKREKIERPEETKKRSIVSRVINIALWIVLLGWMALVVTDYIHVKNEEKPQFCWFNEKTTDYSDGTVTECTGLGYKVINYNRTSFKAIEFGPFWTQDRTADKK